MVALGRFSSVMCNVRSKQASLFGSDVSLDSPLEGHSLWDLALIMPGLARRFHFISADAYGQATFIPNIEDPAGPCQLLHKP